MPTKNLKYFKKSIAASFAYNLLHLALKAVERSSMHDQVNFKYLSNAFFLARKNGYTTKKSSAINW